MKDRITAIDARESIRLFRDAVNQIRLLLRSAVPRWADGLPCWHAPSEPTVEHKMPSLYTSDELQVYREAREKLLRSVELNPYLADAYFLIGNAYGDIDGDTATLLRFYDDAIAIDPDNDEFYNARMHYNLSAGRLSLARVDLDHLERLHSEYVESKRKNYNAAERNG